MAHKGYKQTPEHIANRIRLGPHKKGWKLTPETIERIRLAKIGSKNPMWKGDHIKSKESGRGRAQRLYPNPGPCRMCGSLKSERHHVDDNTANNDPSNIDILCRRCHMDEDGRLKALVKQSRFARSQQKAKQYIFNGRSQSLKEWAKELDIKYITLWHRINDFAWTLEEAFSVRPKSSSGEPPHSQDNTSLSHS